MRTKQPAGLALALLSLVAGALAAGAKPQQPAPFFSIKDGKTSARRIQQQPAPDAGWRTTTTTTNAAAAATTTLAPTTTTTGAAPTTAGPNLTSAAPEALVGDSRQLRIGANSLADGQLGEPQPATTGEPAASTGSGDSNQQQQQQQVLAVSTPSSLSLSLDGMVVNSRPRAEPGAVGQAGQGRKSSAPARATARSGELAEAKASRRVPLQGQPLASPASKGQRNRERPAPASGQQQTGSSSLFGPQANDLMSVSPTRGARPAAGQQQLDGFGEDQQQVRLSAQEPGAGSGEGLVEPASLELMRNLIQQAGAARAANQQGQPDVERPEDMVMSVMSSADGKERRLVMIARDTLDSLQRYAQQQQMEAAARQQQQQRPLAATKTAARRPQQEQSSGWMGEPEVGSWQQQQQAPQVQTTTALANIATSTTTSQQTATAGAQTTTSSTTARPATGGGQEEAAETPALVSSGLRGAMADSFREVAADQVEPQTGRTNGQQVASAIASQQTKPQAAAKTTTNGQQRVGPGQEARWRQQQQSGSGRSQSPPPPPTTTAASVGPPKQSRRKNKGDSKVAAKQQAKAASAKSSSGGAKKPAGGKKQVGTRRPASELGASTPSPQQQPQSESQPQPQPQLQALKPAERSNQLDRQLDELERGQRPAASEEPLGDPRNQLESLRASIPGEPQLDYPIHGQPPRTSFDCQAQSCPGGYYADPEAQCQVFHVCQSDGRRDTFLCPNGTIFSQQHFVCVWWWQVDCQQSLAFYKLNDAIYCNSMLPAAVTVAGARQQLLPAANQAIGESGAAGEAAGSAGSLLLDSQQPAGGPPAPSTLGEAGGSSNTTSGNQAGAGPSEPAPTSTLGNQQDSVANGLASEAELNQQQQQQLELLARRA